MMPEPNPMTTQNAETPEAAAFLDDPLGKKMLDDVQTKAREKVRAEINRQKNN